MVEMGFRNFRATIERREQSRGVEVCLDYLQSGPKKEAERTNSDVRWLAACRTISDGRRGRNDGGDNFFRSVDG